MSSRFGSLVPDLEHLVVLTPLVLTLVWAGDRQAVAQPGKTDGLTVQISLYSGRPDPVLPLDPDADSEVLSEIARLVAAAPPAEGFEGSSVIPSILGYRGVLVHDPASRTRLPVRIAAYDGFLETYDGDRVSFFLDEERQLEIYLLELAVERGVVEEGLLEIVRPASDEPPREDGDDSTP